MGMEGCNILIKQPIKANLKMICMKVRDNYKLDIVNAQINNHLLVKRDKFPSTSEREKTR